MQVTSFHLSQCYTGLILRHHLFVSSHKFYHSPHIPLSWIEQIDNLKVFGLRVSWPFLTVDKEELNFIDCYLGYHVDFCFENYFLYYLFQSKKVLENEKSTFLNRQIKYLKASKKKNVLFWNLPQPFLIDQVTTYPFPLY